MASGASRRHCPPRTQRDRMQRLVAVALQCEKERRRRRSAGKSSMAWLWPVRTAEPCLDIDRPDMHPVGVILGGTNRPGACGPGLEDDVCDLELSHREWRGAVPPLHGDGI